MNESRNEFDWQTVKESNRDSVDASFRKSFISGESSDKLVKLKKHIHLKIKVRDF